MRYLFIRFSALGDVAMLAPIVRETVEADDSAEITVLSKPFCAPIFENISPRVRFFGADPKKGEYAGIGGMWRLFRRLRRERFDYVCDMHDVLRTKLLRLFFVFAGYKVSHIDKHRRLRKIITAQGDKKRLTQLPTSFENYRAAIPSVHNSQSTIHNRKPTVERKGLADSKGLAVSLAPFAAHAGKIYPLDQMRRVVETLIQRRPDIRIYLFGGGGKEAELMLEWERAFPDNVTAASVHLQERRKAEPDLVPMREELRLIAQSDAMLSMDSANMHLASLVGTRVVSVWGATHPKAGFLGWEQSEADCVQVDLPCRPCSIYGGKPCSRGDLACMRQITPEMIVRRLLD